MEREFVLAVISAIIVFILTLVFGEDIGNLLKIAGVAVVIIPIAFYFIVGMFGMMNAEPTNIQKIGDATNAKIINFTVEQLP